ncbi:nitrile hydratase subunit beta [Pseudooceanicola sp. C21-150M6]|uniref:nitrile hydratase subunit beta n=1 Tax=Pseudooceanicola sp. C21-150M6 TaxID=3434355 RepID=UPI003D7F31CC
MNGIHDLGGAQGFGPIPIATGDKEFRDLEDWEKRVTALNWSPITSGSTIDWFRHVIERMVPKDYLNFSYFQKWCTADLVIMLEAGTITLDDVMRGHVNDPVAPPSAMTVEDTIAGVAASAFDFARQTSQAPLFTIGDRVRARRLMTSNHTRLPGYVRGCEGEVIAHHGAHVLPDRNAEGVEVPEHLYTICFRAVALWGDGANPRDDVTLDLWESYLVST